MRKVDGLSEHEGHLVIYPGRSKIKNGFFFYPHSSAAADRTCSLPTKYNSKKSHNETLSFFFYFVFFFISYESFCDVKFVRSYSSEKMYINLFLSTYDRDAGLGLIDN